MYKYSSSYFVRQPLTILVEYALEVFGLVQVEMFPYEQGLEEGIRGRRELDLVELRWEHFSKIKE